MIDDQMDWNPKPEDNPWGNPFDEPFEECPFNGRVCTVCGEPQRTTSCGPSCSKGHGVDFDQCPLNGLLCVICGEPQRNTPGGASCSNDHGGANGVAPPVAATPPVDFPCFGDGEKWELVCGDCLAVLKTLADNSIQCCVTSPPYWGLRQYLFDGAVVIRPDLDSETKRMVEKELEHLGIKPRL